MVEFVLIGLNLPHFRLEVSAEVEEVSAEISADGQLTGRQEGFYRIRSPRGLNRNRLHMIYIRP